LSCFLALIWGGVLDAAREPQHYGSMPKRKTPELTPSEQYKRFKEAAKKAGVTKSEEEFERTFKKVVRPTTRKSSSRDDA
jgi:hypothetical protein